MELILSLPGLDIFSGPLYYHCKFLQFERLEFLEHMGSTTAISGITTSPRERERTEEENLKEKNIVVNINYYNIIFYLPSQKFVKLI